MRSWPPGREKTTLQQSIYRHDIGPNAYTRQPCLHISLLAKFQKRRVGKGQFTSPRLATIENSSPMSVSAELEVSKTSVDANHRLKYYLSYFPQSSFSVKPALLLLPEIMARYRIFSDLNCAQLSHTKLLRKLTSRMMRQLEHVRSPLKWAQSGQPYRAEMAFQNIDFQRSF